MAVHRLISLLVLATTTTFSTSSHFASANKAFTLDIKIRYFTTGRLVCDHPMFNITERNDIVSLSWIFPDGSMVTPQTNLDPNLYSLRGLPDDVIPASNPVSKYDGYNLTVLEVDDGVFGYYTCLVLLSGGAGSSGGSPSVASIRWGLNVDGADFSELMEEYRHNAIVGGIAAGAVLALLGLGCLVWYLWFNEKIPDDEFQENGNTPKIGIDEKVIDSGCDGYQKNDDHIYQNKAFHVETNANEFGMVNEKGGTEHSETNFRL